jgi:hypothetical protein
VDGRETPEEDGDRLAFRGRERALLGTAVVAGPAQASQGLETRTFCGNTWEELGV